jgi:hypothetical protein
MEKTIDKQVKTSIPSEVYLSILEGIKNHGKLPRLGMSKSRLEKYVYRLKRDGKIKRVGYGTWELAETSIPPPGFTINHLGLKVYLPCANKLGKEVRSDDVRVHNLVFRIKLETPLSWESRLKARDVPFNRLKFGVLQVVHADHKVWLCNGKVLVFVPSGLDYTARKVSKGLQLAVRDFFSFIPGLEAFLGFSLRSGQGYVWGVTRKHLSLVKNALAQDYNRRKEKLKFYDEAGLWMIADDSYNLGELEFVRSSTNQGEANLVQDWFNDLKKNPVKQSEVMQMFKALSFNFAQLGDVVAGLTQAVQVIRDVLEKR